MRILRNTSRGLTEGTVETKVLNGRDYLVVPVVALVEGVRHANGASSPELVPASAFGRFPDSWNGRPVVVDHPVNGDGVAITASSPDVLENSYLGKMLNANVEDGKLKTEAWLDLKAIESSDSDKIQEMWARLDAGEVCEVSVGCIVYMKEQEGEYKGKKYNGIWDIVIPDHLAFLSSDQIGACSIADGCGTYRTQSSGKIKLSEGARMAVRNLMKKSGGSSDKPKAQLKKASSVPDNECSCKGGKKPCGCEGEQQASEIDVATASLNRALFASEVMDMDRRGYLQRALEKDGRFKYCYVMAFSDNFVVFSKYEDDEYKTFKISFSSDESNKVILSGEPEEVMFQAKVVPVNSENLSEPTSGKKSMAKSKSKSEDDRDWKEDDTIDDGDGNDSEDAADDEEDKKSKSKSKGKDKKMAGNPQSIDELLKSLEGSDVGRQLAAAVAFSASEKSKAISKLLKAGSKHLKKEALEKMELDVLQGMVSTIEDISSELEEVDDETSELETEENLEDSNEEDTISKSNLKKSDKSKSKKDMSEDEEDTSKKRKSYAGKAGSSAPERRSAVAPEAPDVFAFGNDGSLKKEAA